MKRHELVFSIIKIPLDFIIITLSFFIARELRLVTDLIPWVSLPIKTIDTKWLFIYALLCACVSVFILMSHWLYNIKITNSKIKENFDIIRFSFYSFIFFSVIVYLGRDFIYKKEIPRLIILFSFFISTFWAIIQRIILNEAQFYLLKKWFLSKKNIILINNKKFKEIEYIIEDIRKCNIYTIVWYINQENKEIKYLKYLWGMNEVESLFSQKKCDEILYIESDFSKKELYKIWEIARIFGIRYRYITNTFDVTRSNTSLSLINEIAVIEINNTPLNDWWRIIKRLIDIVGSILGIIIFSPLIIITGILIKLDDFNAPIIYKNRRVGQNWKIFNLYKFRYLKWEYCVKDSYGIDEEEDKALKFEKKLIQEKSKRHWPLYKIHNDPRKTKIGKFIEKYSIDEIPQFFNVFVWNMSLVGPRPHQPREVKNYEINHKRLLTIKPWITGMAQVNGREENDFTREANLDIFYIENWNILLDLKIIFKTFFTILGRK